MDSHGEKDRGERMCSEESGVIAEHQGNGNRMLTAEATAAGTSAMTDITAFKSRKMKICRIPCVSPGTQKQLNLRKHTTAIKFDKKLVSYYQYYRQRTKGNKNSSRN